jgi:serine/threonine protein kinase/Tfp pilus assembly protein PilF
MMDNEVILEKYRLVEKLQDSPIALTYRGVDVESDLAAIVTVFKEELILAKEFMKRFKGVVEKLSGLDLPNAVPMLDYGEYENQAIVVQGLIVGQALSEMLEESTGLQVNLVLDIAQQMGEYLGVLHQAGIVHGGLDSTCIILAMDGNIKVMNAGLAQAAGVVKLIPSHKLDARPFDAPEVRAGGELTPCADFYALGVILFQALTGEVLKLDPKIPYSRSQRIGLLPELDELIAKCLQTDPTWRVQSSAEFLNGIEEVRRGMETGAQHPKMGVEDALVGHTLGAYQLVERLGHGGMATVYKAYEPVLDRYVAIKVLRKFFAQDPEFMQRFRREAKAIAKLNHPNIVPIHSYGEQGEIAYIVMRYVEGGTLKQACGQVFEPERAVRLLLPIVRALAYAHQRGIVHRDIKPSNVLLSEGGWPMLTDYGLAKMVEATSKLTGSGVGMGTPMYMSPEQGQAVDVDHRTDIYSVGIMLYEMLTGDVPFHADTPMAIVIQHISSPMPMPRQVNPNIPEVLERIILKATAKSPDDRFQTAEELITALEHSLSVLQGVTKDEPDKGKTRVRSPVSDEDAEKRLERNYIDGLSAYWIKDWAKARAYFQVVVEAQSDYKDVAGLLAEVEAKLKLGELYQQAQDAITNEDWGSARAALGELVAADPGYNDAAELLGKVNARLRLAELYAQARQLSQAGKWQAVVGVFEHIQALEPGYDPDGLLPVAQHALEESALESKLDDLYRQALDAMKAGKWEIAREFLEGVQGEKPGYRETEQLLERIAAEIAGEEAPLEREHIPWIRKVPGWGWALGGLAVVAVLVGVIGGNAGLFRGPAIPTTIPTSLAVQESQDFAYWREHGWTYFVQNNYEAAKEAFDQAIELNPEDWSSWQGRARAYRELGDTQAAIENFNQAIELNPEVSDIYIDRGWLYFENLSEYKLALSDFSMAIKIHPDEPYNYYCRGYVYQWQGRDDDARADFEKVLEITGGDPSFEHHSFIVQWLAESETGEFTHPELQDYRYWQEHGWTYYEQKNYEAAKEAFDKAIELNPEDWSPWSGRARVYREQGDVQAAIQNYERAVVLNPEDGGLYIERGWFYFEAVEDFDMAFSDFNKAIALQPEPNNYFQRGHAYRLLGMVNEARADFERYLEITNGDPSAEWHDEITQWLAENPEIVPGCVEPPPGLVSWWTGDGHPRDVVGGNSVTLNNGTEFGQGKVGDAFFFPSPDMDGQDGFVEAGSTSNLDDLTELTIEAWVMLNTGPAYRIERFVTIAVPDSNVPKAVLRIEGGPGDVGHLHFYMGINREFQHLLSEEVPGTGSFHHVTGTYDGSVMRLYLDGEEVGKWAVSGEVASGESYVFMSSNEEPLDGLLDEVSIYNRALTAGEIQAIYEAGSAGKCKH